MFKSKHSEYPSKDIQQLESYKDFQIWFSQFKDCQLSYCPRGQEPERSGPAPAFTDYTENSFNAVHDVIFEFLPFCFQVGVFNKYFSHNGILLNMNQDEIHIKSEIERLFQLPKTKTTMFKPNRFTVSFNEGNSVLELYNPTTTYYQNAVNITQTKLIAQLTYLNQDTNVMEYVYNNIKYIASFKFDFKSEINISGEIITNDIKYLNELESIETHKSNGEYCKIIEYTENNEDVRLLYLYNSNHVFIKSYIIVLSHTVNDKITLCGVNPCDEGYCIIQGNFYGSNHTVRDLTVTLVSELYFKSTNAEQLNPDVKIEFYAEPKTDSFNRILLLFEGIIINCKQYRYKYDESGVVLPIYDITVEVDGKQRQIEAFELGTNCYKL